MDHWSAELLLLLVDIYLSGEGVADTSIAGSFTTPYNGKMY